ncbi:hypothetical protein [Halomarina litorea]|uniref:hypothetical protein n=1 Tax=Halomarina litorea TaxID=2961595 RepID=UPI0020C224BD|nr:hypothetical protein [Halomarina sp. BCD28]
MVDDVDVQRRALEQFPAHDEEGGLVDVERLAKVGERCEDSEEDDHDGGDGEARVPPQGVALDHRSVSDIPL